MLDHGRAKSSYDIAAQNDVLLDLGVAQIQISVLKTKRLVRLSAVVDLKRKLVVAAASENIDRGRDDFDIAGCLFGVLAAALSDNTCHGDRRFLVNRLESLHHLFCLHDDLCCAVKISQHDKSQISGHDPEILKPSGKRDGLADVSDPQLRTGMRS